MYWLTDVPRFTTCQEVMIALVIQMPVGITPTNAGSYYLHRLSSILARGTIVTDIGHKSFYSAEIGKFIEARQKAH